MTIEVLREGKSVTTLEARLWQDDAVQTILVASFGASRASSIEVKQEPVVPAYVSPENLSVIPLRNICLNAFSILKSVGLRGIIR